MRDANIQADAFEKQAIQHHADTTGHKTWPWVLVPEQTLLGAGYINDFMYRRLNRLQRYQEGQNPFADYGADGIAEEGKEDGNSDYHVLQMKHHPCGKRITAKDLGSTFVVRDNMRRANPASRTYLYYHGRLEKHLEGYFLGNSEWVAEHLPSCVSDTVKYLPIETPQTLQEPVESLTVGKPQVHSPAPAVPKFWLHQEECLAVLAGEWDGRVSIFLPPGTGKTHIMNQFAREHYKKVIYVSPYIAHVEQNLERFRPFATPDTLLIPVHSETGGIRNLKTLRDKISNPNWLLSSTYDSAKDVLLALFSDDFYDDVLLIIDEVHNAEKSKELYELGNHFRQVLGATATILNDTEYPPIYTYRLEDAIKEDIICDYRIYIPEVMADDEAKSMDELGTDTLTLQARFLLDGLLMTGSRRTIAKTSDTVQCEAFRKTLMNVAKDYHGFEPVIYIITSDSSQAERRKILDDFDAEGEDDVIKIILHIKILVEAIDVPRCDSVYLNKGSFANNCTPVQAAFRANRRLASHPNKVANIFVWADENADLIDTFTLLRDGDPSFIKKTGIIGRDYDRQGDKEVRERLNAKTEAMHQFFTVKCVSLHERWFQRLNELRAFYLKEKRWPSHGSKDEEKKRLGTFLHTQRNQYSNKTLTLERIDALNNISPEWRGNAGKGATQVPFEEKVEALRAFYLKEKRWPSTTSKDEKEKSLGIFLSTQRKQYSNKTLPQERIEALDRISPLWRGNAGKGQERIPFEEKVEALRAFYLKEKRWPSTHSKDEEEKMLGNFLRTQRNRYSNKTLPQERIEALDRISPSWIGNAGKGATQVPFEENVEELRTFYLKEGRWPSTTSKDEKEKSLGHFLSNKRNNKNLPQERIEALNGISPSWRDADKEQKRIQFEENVEDLRAFYLKEGHWPSQISKGEEKRLGKFLSHQRQNKNLPQERIEALNGISPSWREPRRNQFEKKVEALRAFYLKEKRWPSQISKDKEEKSLGNFLSHQRQNKKNEKLPQNRIDLLESLHSSWIGKE
ncbi:MAG: Helicase associated domain protein [Nitrososphaerales archaeon]